MAVDVDQPRTVAGADDRRTHAERHGAAAPEHQQSGARGQQRCRSVRELAERYHLVIEVLQQWVLPVRDPPTHGQVPCVVDVGAHGGQRRQQARLHRGGRPGHARVRRSTPRRCSAHPGRTVTTSSAVPAGREVVDVGPFPCG